MSIAGSDAEGAGEAEVYSSKIIPGLKTGSPIVVEGVIVDFIGKNKTIYIDSRNLRMLE